MAKARTRKPTPPHNLVKTAEPKKHTPLSPEKVHALFGLAGPYDPPPPPDELAGYAAFWDCGISIEGLRRRHRSLFYAQDFLDRAKFARETDSWRWRQIRLAPTEPNLTFAEQQKQFTNSDRPAAARELVTFLVLHYLTTGERFEMDRWRCRDVSRPGARVIVGPFTHLGLDIGTVSDEWKSPGVGLSAVFTPPRKE